MATNTQALIEEKAEIVKQAFIEACQRKVRSGGFDTSNAEDNHGSNGLAPVYASALNDLYSEQKDTMSKRALKDSKNLDSF
tara:strand:+ start:24826 stop:25068 length:243 start_codon:yes stop_codon:yes gene_type:complete